MDITNDLLSKIIGGDSSSKVNILKWHIVNDIVESGTSHTSELSRLVVEYQRKFRIFKKSFILKIPSDHPMYEMGLKYGMYEREYPTYTTVLEEMYKIDGEHIGPRLYYAGEKYTLILKDLSMSGYKMVDRVQQLDYQQCSIVFQSIAKFHALSIKLNQNNPMISSKYGTYTWVKNPVIVEKTNHFINNTMDCFENLFNIKSSKLSEMISRFKADGAIETFMEQINPDRFRINALIHGDLWTGNTLFKYDKYGIAKKVKLIDFQRCYWTAPAYDIWFFTITSMRFDVFEKHFDYLLEIYMDTLNKILKYLNCGSYSLHDLKSDLDQMELVAIHFASLCLPQFISTRENPCDFKNGEVNGECFDYDRYNRVYDNEVYVEIMQKWISYFENKGKKV